MPPRPCASPGYQFCTVEYLICALSSAINSTTAACNWCSSREGQRFECVIEAQQVDRARDAAGRMQSGEGIGRRPEANVPQDKLARVMLEPFHQAQLPDIQRLRLGHRANHRMKGLVMGERMNAVRPVR